MSCKCSDVIKVMNGMFPEQYALEWDNVGLLVGDPDREVEKIITALDATKCVVEEAVENRAEMIITHHPLIFHPIKKLNTSDGIGGIIAMLNKHGIALYAAHTNMDISGGGVNDALARALQLQETRILDKTAFEQCVKLVVFVPKGYEGSVMEAIGEAGAGWIGNYSHCTFRVDGIGTFKPLDGANPFIGQVGRVEEVNETRLETIVKKKDLGSVIDAMLSSHPYEEVAYDIYPLDNEVAPAGLGRIGKIHQPMRLGDYALYVKACLKASGVKVIGNMDRHIETVAVCSGSGGDFIDKAFQAGADVLITGDVSYHDALRAEELGIGIIDAGHYPTENCVISEMGARLQKALDALQYNVNVIVSARSSDPFKFA